jgi:hypothetical protein
LLLLFCVGELVATPAVDFNRTHATNPLWTRHARFHVVWQIVSQCFFGAFAGWLAWRRGLGSETCFYVAVAILAIPLTAFLVAAIMRRIYDGALHDSNGILPWRLNMKGKPIDIDLNLMVALGGLAYLAGIAVLYRR